MNTNTESLIADEADNKQKTAKTQHDINRDFILRCSYQVIIVAFPLAFLVAFIFWVFSLSPSLHDIERKDVQSQALMIHKVAMSAYKPDIDGSGDITEAIIGRFYSYFVFVDRVNEAKQKLAEAEKLTVPANVGGLMVHYDSSVNKSSRPTIKSKTASGNYQSEFAVVVKEGKLMIRFNDYPQYLCSGSPIALCDGR